MKIIMYHYIKDFKNTEFPKLKGIDVKNFEFQIKYLKSKYKILNPREIHEIVKKKENLKDNYCWLTFDDGYIDHYQYVIPILEKHNLKGSFFPPVRAVLQETVLDVNKIQLILSKNDDHDFLLEEIKKVFSKLTTKNNASSFDNFLRNIHTTSRFDSSKIVLIKSLLQKKLSKEIRNKICDILFKKYVSNDESLIAKKIYMNLSQIKEIFDLGHEIGFHCYDHDFLGMLSKIEQSEEILKTLNFFKKNQIINEQFTMCYPYGDYNSDTLNILREIHCSIALTTKVGSVPKSRYVPLEFPRYDTNDFPLRPNFKKL